MEEAKQDWRRLSVKSRRWGQRGWGLPAGRGFGVGERPAAWGARRQPGSSPPCKGLVLPRRTNSLSH